MAEVALLPGLIRAFGVRRTLALAVLLGFGAGCAPAADSRPLPVTALAAEETDAEGALEEESVPNPDAVPEAPAKRGKLVHSLTLGAGAYGDGPREAARPEVGSDAVAAGAPGYVYYGPAGPGTYGASPYGGYYGASYGYYGAPAYGSYYRSAPSASRGAGRGNGWEGAQRTAKPGDTPNIGGNWAPPADHGPSPMR